MSIISQVQPEIIFDTEANKTAYGALPDKTLVYVEETKIHWIYDSTMPGYRILTTTGNIFTQTGDKTVANTTTETSILDNGTGTKILSSGFLNVGRNIEIRIRWFYSRTSGDITIKIKLDGTTVLSTWVITIPTGTNRGYTIDTDITLRSTGVSGTVIWQGQFSWWASSGGAVNNIFPFIDTAPIVIDTTIDQPVEVTAQWTAASAGNTITTTNVNIII